MYELTGYGPDDGGAIAPQLAGIPDRNIVLTPWSHLVSRQGYVTSRQAKGAAAEFQPAAPIGQMPFHSRSAFRVGIKPSFDLLLLFWWVQF